MTEERFVAHVLEGEEDIDFLVSQAGRLLAIRDEAAGAHSSRKQRRSKNVPIWREALSEVVADMAGETDAVRLFRAGELGGTLLKRDEVEHWIIQTEIQDARPFGGWISLKGKEPEYLQYLRPHSNSIASRVVGRHGTLRRLYEICQSLVGSLDWLGYQATMFVLTDEAPRIPPLRYNAERRPPYSTLSRIVLKVNLSMTPRELYEAFAEIRGRVLGERKPHTISKKHASLAVFAARIEKPELTTEDMKA